jgi:uncharacterized cupredoxin-like copper-binding protein
MNLRITALVSGVLALLCVGAFVAGCGSSDESSTTAAEDSGETAGTSTSAAAGGQSLEVAMGDYFYDPVDAEAKAGTVNLSAPNEGDLPHELVLAKTNDDPANLPTLGDGSVDEESLDVPGEVGEAEAGTTGTATVDLQPGKYVMFCNLPGHYAAGMYGTLTVK